MKPLRTSNQPIIENVKPGMRALILISILVFLAQVKAAQANSIIIHPDGRIDIQRRDSKPQIIYRCRRAINLRRFAWVASQLYIACPGQPIVVWSPGHSYATVCPSLADLRPRILGGGNRLYVVGQRRVWSYQPNRRKLRKLPAPPTNAV